jgi:transposase
MEYGAIDLHKRRSEVRIVTAEGTIVLERRIDTTPADFDRVFGERGHLRILIESSTESEWVAQHLERLGHEVIVADPNYAAMYGSRSRRVKTDKRDVAALAEACRTGIYRVAHRASAAARELRRTLRVRSHLVRQRASVITLLRSLLRQEGVRLASGTVEGVLARLAKVSVSDTLAAAIAPLRTMVTQLNTTLEEIETTIDARATADPVTQHLMSAPGVGPIVALTFQAVLDTPTRFVKGAASASAFVGLVPSEDSSGEQHRKGAITKAGPRDLRALLVQASWVIWRSKSAGGAALRAWAHALAARRGRRVAVVALARRLTRILYALWRDRTDFQGARLAATRAAGHA